MKDQTTSKRAPFGYNCITLHFNQVPEPQLEESILVDVKYKKCNKQVLTPRHQ